MANWRWVYYYLVQVGELALPVYMCVGAACWIVANLKTWTLIVVIEESLRHCFMHLCALAPRGVDDSPMVNLVRLGFFLGRGHLFVLVCVGVDLFGLKTFTSIVVGFVVIVFLRGSLRHLSLLHCYYPAAAAWQWVCFFLLSSNNKVTWRWLTAVLSIVFLIISLKAFVFLVLVLVCVAFIIEDHRSVAGFLNLRAQLLLLLMCGGAGLFGLIRFASITFAVVALEWFLAIVAVAVDATQGVGVTEGTSISSKLVMAWRPRVGFLMHQFIFFKRVMCLFLCAVLLVRLELDFIILTPTPSAVVFALIIFMLAALVIVVGASIFLNRRGRAVAVADDLAHALNMHQSIFFKRVMCLFVCAVLLVRPLVELDFITLTPIPSAVVFTPIIFMFAVLVIVVGAFIFLNRRGRAVAVADDLAHALNMLREVEEKLFFLDPYPYSERRCQEWHVRVKHVRDNAKKSFLDDDGDGVKHRGCSIGLCSTCQEAETLLMNAIDLASEGKRLVTELRRLRRQDRILTYEHKYKTLHGMAMASYGMKVLDFVEGASSSWSSVLGIMMMIPGMRGGVGKTTGAMMGIWGVRGVGKTTLLRSVSDTYAHDAASPFDHVFLLGAGGGGCTVDRLRHALSVNIGGRPTTISRQLRGKSFLLLLDDVREKLDLAAVGLPMPLGHRQKVVFTTRYPGVCAEMGCGNGDTVIQMECLGELDAWNLFKERVGDEIIHAHPHIKHIANKMVAECRGLPSALCTLGRAMSTKRDVKEWRYAYDVLLKRKPTHHHQVHEIQEMGG